MKSSPNMHASAKHSMSSTHSNPDLTKEVDLTKNPAFNQIPKYYKENFPGLFDQSIVNKNQQGAADKLRKLPFHPGQSSDETLAQNSVDRSR